MTEPRELEVTVERALTVPVVNLYVNVDVNDLLEERSEEAVFEFLGKLKDLFDPDLHLNGHD